MIDTQFRLDAQGCRALLGRRLQEPAPSRIQLLVGPRQVGKTSLLLGIAKEHGARARYAAGDGPELAAPGAWERIWGWAEETAAARRYAIVLLDEIQHVAGWAARLKAEWDRLRRKKTAVHVVASGSSSLRIGAGSRESLAGRFERIVLTHWTAQAVSSTFGLPPDAAARQIVLSGCYPGAQDFLRDRARWTAYVRDSILEPAITRDILSQADVRRPALLRQVFAVAAAYPAQIVAVHKIQGQLAESGASETIAQYLHLLEEAFLVTALEKHTQRPLRRRAAPPKLVTLNNSLLAAADPRGAPDPVREPERYGRWVENACLAYAWNSGQSVRYWREEPLEVDVVLHGEWGSWAIEVKTGPVEASDVAGLAEFCRRFPSFRPLLVCDDDNVKSGDRLGIDAVGWRRFLLEGPPR